MKKNIFLLTITALATCNIHAREQASWRHHYTQQPAWKHNGIYIVNKSDGYLTVTWNETQKISIPPVREPNLSKALIPVPVGTTVHVSYSDTVQDHANLPSCRDGAKLSFTTNDRMVLYEIYGGYEEGKGPFNRPGIGQRCHIKMHHQSLNPKRAIEKYPALQ